METIEVILQAADEAGLDLSRPQCVEFRLIFQRRGNARRFAMWATMVGYSCQIEMDDINWAVDCSRRMVPAEDKLTATETRLADLAKEMGGQIAGCRIQRIR